MKTTKSPEAVRNESRPCQTRRALTATLLAATLLCVWPASPIWAQSARDGFDPNANDTVYATVVQPDGKIVVGGAFTSIGGGARSCLARLYPDGTLDTNFTAQADGTVFALALQPDGKILVGGRFTELGGQPRAAIARLNSNGSLDEDFNPGADRLVLALAVQSDGMIVVGGQFRTLAGKARDRIARLSADGSLDRDFDPGANGQVNALALQPDGKILVGGVFTQLAGQTRNRIGRLDPRAGVADAFNPGADDTVECLLLQVDGKIVVGGRFGMLGGAEHKHLGRLNSNGSADAALSVGADGWVYSLARQADGKILVGGDFTEVGGGTRSRLGRLNLNGTLDTTFNPGANGVVRALGVQPDGSVLVSGEFTTLGGQTRNRIGRVHAGGTVDTDFNLGINGMVSAIAVQPDGKILIGGSFSSLGAQTLQNLARLHPDGTPDAAFNPQVFAEVRAMALQPDGAIVIVIHGLSTSVGGLPRTGLARVNADGTVDSRFDPNPQHLYTWTPEVNCLAIQTNGAIVVGGNFASIGGQAHTNIARLNPDGSADDSFNASAGIDGELLAGEVKCLAIQSDGKIVVGGFFDQLCGVARDGLGRLNPSGTLDSQVNPLLDGSVNCLALQPDGKILIGGTFRDIDGWQYHRIARLYAHGGVDSFFVASGADSGLDGPFHSVLSLAVQGDGKIIIGGQFTTLNGQSRTNIGRLHPTGSLDTTFDPRANFDPFPDSGEVNSLAIQADGKILVGGLFTSLGGQSRENLGRLSSSTAVSQSFSVNSCGSMVTWDRGGATPEVEQVIFLESLDGAGWSRLGPGSRVAGGWRLEGLSLPAGTNVLIRAQGRTMGGYHDGSSGLIESTFLYFDASHADATAPVAGTDEYQLRGNTDYYLYVSSLLANDTDAENDPLSIVSVANGPHDTVMLTEFPGTQIPTVRYRATAGYAGPDFFTYLLTDGCSTRTGIVNVVVGIAPDITDYPAWRSVLPGAAVTFSVTATGVPTPDYQWWVGNRVLTNDTRVSGATTSSLTLSNVQFADSGLYFVGVTNAFGFTSAGAALTVANVPAVESFNPGVNGTVESLALQPDGRILVGGAFNWLGGESRRALARLALDGSLDPDFHPVVSSGSGNYYVRSLALQPDGKILVAGYFDSLAGSSRAHVGRLHADGSLDATFVADAATPSMPEFVWVECVALQPDGGILVGGNFTALKGQSRNHIGRLDTNGNLDSSFNPGANGTVQSIAIQADGKILVGGEFQVLAGQSRRYLGRLNANGSLDAAFNPDPSEAVDCVTVQPDGKILVGGRFNGIGGQSWYSRPSLARLNPDGTLDESFYPLVEGAARTVRSIVIQSDGKILAAGNFVRVSGQSRAHLARFTSAGSLDATFNPGANDDVCSLMPLPDGSIVVGGAFTELGGRARAHIALLPADGPAWQNLGISSSGTMVTWARGGAAPEVEQVSFAQSANGTSFTPLGNGERIPGGWRLQGLSLPVAQTFHIRAQGRTTGGRADASSGLLVSTQAFFAATYVNNRPVMKSATPSGNSVQLRFDGEGGRTYQLQHAPAVAGTYTNLPGVQIVPAGTNTAICTHTNSKAGAGFYRAVSQ